MRTHRAWWQTYYPRSFLSVPDTRMESFYWIQMYKLASGTRADRPALDLMGPWFRRTPWPKIWWNLNLQLTYWPVYAANRLDLGESLTRMIDANISNLIDNDRNGRRITALDLRKGETVWLTPANAKLTPADFVIEPVAAEPGRLNFYGSLKARK